MLAEERLDLAVEATRLGPGEPVIVITKMGKEVARGTVQEGTPGGSISIMVSDQGPGGVEQVRSYSAELYSFIPQDDDTEDEDDPEPMFRDEPTEPPIVDMSSTDARVEAKFVKLGISLVEQPEGDNVKDGGSPDGEKTAPKSKDANPRADSSEPDASVNIDALPEQLKKKIIGVKGLDEAQRDKVLSEISDAALRGLRDVGVKSNEIYKTISEIQAAVMSVLGKGKVKEGES